LNGWVPAPALEAVSVLGLIAGTGARLVCHRGTIPPAGFPSFQTAGAARTQHPSQPPRDVVQELKSAGRPPRSFSRLCYGLARPRWFAAGYVSHVWSLDVAESLAHCARFNAMRNGRENLTVACGDRYEPARGLTASSPTRPGCRRFAPAALFASGGELGGASRGALSRACLSISNPAEDFIALQLGPTRQVRFRGSRRVRAGVPHFCVWAAVDRLPDYGSPVIEGRKSAGRAVTVRRRRARIGTAQIEWLRFGRLRRPTMPSCITFSMLDRWLVGTSSMSRNSSLTRWRVISPKIQIGRRVSVHRPVLDPALGGISAAAMRRKDNGS